MKNIEKTVEGRTQNVAENESIAPQSVVRDIFRAAFGILVIVAIVYFYINADELLSGFNQEWLAVLIIAVIGLSGLYLDSRPPKK